VVERERMRSDGEGGGEGEGDGRGGTDRVGVRKGTRDAVSKRKRQPLRRFCWREGTRENKRQRQSEVMNLMENRRVRERGRAGGRGRGLESSGGRNGESNLRKRYYMLDLELKHASCF
jgi:hypothetical protein